MMRGRAVQIAAQAKMGVLSAMLKIVAIFVLAMGVGIGFSSFITVQDMSSPPVGSSAILASSSTIQPIGPRTTNNFVENCEGRCRCSSYYVTETVATPGIVTASTEFDVPLKRKAQCPSSGGMNYGNPVEGQAGHCYVCPSDMTYSRLLRNNADLKRRWGFSRDVCVTSKRVCQ